MYCYTRLCDVIIDDGVIIYGIRMDDVGRGDLIDDVLL